MNDTTILLVAENTRLISSVEAALASLAVQLHKVASCAEAAAYLETASSALLVVHVATPSDTDGVAALLRQLADARHAAPALLVCEPNLAHDGLKLLRLGAADCLMRPLDLSRLAYLVDVLTVRFRLAPRPKVEAAPSCVRETQAFIYQAGGSLGRVVEQASQVAPLNTSVLIQGETGTGKTRLARLIHDLSPRRDHPFLTINCGALSANVIESELFGHVRGAFTGAERDRTGKFTAVGEGTLLLDDIDGLPLDLQVKLLQVIEERVFEPVGSNQPQPLRARVIAASNRLLQQEAQAGRFRTDLFYRLGVMVLYVPPLRENLALLSALAQRFVEDYARRDGRPVRGVVPAALQALQEHDWPGNVRELRNVIERAVALCTREWIGLEDLPEPLQPIAAAPLAPAAPERARVLTLTMRKQETEEQVIREVLHRNGNNKLRTAADLGISRMTLYKKLYQYGLMDGMATA